MQVTNVSAYSMKLLLQANAQGIRVVGYTVKPGFSNGLNLTSKEPVGKYVGFSNA